MIRHLSQGDPSRRAYGGFPDLYRRTVSTLHRNRAKFP
jgi:hypothetical protein